jgi:hypothetical protein
MHIQTDRVNNEVHISKQCTATGEVFSLVVDLSQYKKWEGGMLIQDAFPHLHKAYREFIKTGTTPSEWDEMFGTCCLQDEL